MAKSTPSVLKGISAPATAPMTEPESSSSGPAGRWQNRNSGGPPPPGPGLRTAGHSFVGEGEDHIELAGTHATELLQHGQILHIVFGVRDKAEFRPELKEIQKDLCDSHIDGTLSENIRREALEKFSYVSPIGAAGLYYHATAADFQKEGEARELLRP